MFKQSAVKLAAVVAGWTIVGGCASPLSLFNTDFLSQLGVLGGSTQLPNDAPSVLVAVENRTGRTIETRMTWRQGSTSSGGSNVDELVNVVLPGDRQSTTIICPLDEITLGDIGDLTRVGAVVRLGNGNPQDPIIEVEPFGVLLKDGANYDCGDAITFAVIPSSATLSGYQVYAFVSRASANQ
ncbi:MAG: hypothetical protein U1D55_09295 [Phycisphaerae bacterium]